MSTPTITEFLEARITEDEARFDLPEFVLEESAHGYGWGNRGYCPLCDSYQFSGLESVTEEGWWAHAEDAHRMRQRLAECAAKRAIVEEHYWRSAEGQRGCGLCNYNRDYGWEETGPCKTIRALAAVYADHPDYRREWAL
jgi:hypothetical protein